MKLRGFGSKGRKGCLITAVIVISCLLLVPAQVFAAPVEDFAVKVYAVAADSILSNGGLIAIGPSAEAIAGGAVAVGNGTSASGRESVSVGFINKAKGEYASAFGYQSIASGDQSSAFGYKNEARYFGSAAFGHENIAHGRKCTAFGEKNTAGGEDSSAFGHLNVTLPNWSAGFGIRNIIFSGEASSGFGFENVIFSGDEGSAFGYKNKIYSGDEGSAFGYVNIVSADHSSAFGRINRTTGNDSSAFGHENEASGSWGSAFGSKNIASGEESSAFGYGNEASGYWSSAFGRKNVASAYESVAHGIGNTTFGRVSLTFGYKNIASSDLGSAYGYENKILSGVGSSAFGHRNIVTTHSSSAYGRINAVAGDNSSAFGHANFASGRWGAAFGNENRATGEESSAFGHANFATGGWGAAFGNENRALGEGSAAFGHANKAPGYWGSAFGGVNTASGDLSSAFGHGNFVPGRWGSAFGLANQVLGNSGSAFGNENIASGEESSAFGYGNIASAAYSSAFGHEARAEGINSLALGKLAEVTVADGVALGSDSVTDRAAFSSDTEAPFSGFVLNGTNTLGAVSVGSAAQKRQIVNVADGTEETDAVNLRQLRGSAEIPITFKGDTGEVDKKLGESFDIVGDGTNIATSVDGGKLKIALNDDISVNNITATGNIEAASFISGGKTYINADGLNANGKKIINVAAASADTDAVNFSQLKNIDAKLEALSSDVASGGAPDKPITFKGDTGEVDKKLGESFDIVGDGTNIATSVDGGKMKIALNDDISVNNITATGNVEAASFISGGKTYINADGLNANNKKITNVAAGENDTDASNFGQLKAVDDKVETVSSDVEAIKTEVAENTGKIDAVSGDLSAVKSDVTANTVKIDAVSGDLAMVKTEVTELGGKVDTLSGDVAALGNKPITFAADTGSADRKLGETFNINGDGGNISTSIDGSGDLTIAMSDSPIFGTVAVNSGDAGTVEGLSNTDLEADDFATVGRAATEEQLAIVDDKVDTLSGDLSAVKSDVTANTVKIDAVSSDLGAVKTEVTELGGKVDTLSGDLSAVKSDVTANTVKIDAVSGDLAAAKTEVTELGGKVDTLSGDLAAVKTEVTELGGKVDTLSGDVAALGNKPITFAADTGSADRKLGETFNINGDGVNVLTEIDGSGDLTVKLSESLTFGDVKINESGDATITGLNNKTIDGADFADDSGRAATEEQLKQAMDAMSFDIKAGNNIDVTKTNDGVKDEYTVALKDDIEVTSVKADSVTADEYKVGGEIYIDNRGINANNKTITNVAAGELSATSTEAVNGRQLWETNERVSKNESAIRRIDGNVRNLSDRVVELDDDIKDTGALSAALAGLRPIDYNPYEPTQIMASLGYYRDSYGVALGVAHYTQQSTMWHAGLSFGSGSHVMANAGVTFTLGRTGDGKGIQSGGYQVIKALTTENASLKQNIANLEDTVNKLLDRVEELEKAK